MTDQQKLVIGKFFANFFLHIGDKHSEEKTIRMYAELNREHPDVYIILHPAFAGVQDDFKGGESAKNFLKFASSVNLSYTVYLFSTLIESMR